MNMKKWTICAGVLFLLSTLLTACGNDGAAATAMRLRKTEGTVRVSDNKNAVLELLEGMGLYSGYQVSTQRESYAWIDLDSVKLTKMDQETLAEIQKEGQKLEIIVKSGSLFFHVTEPLGDDETMDIRTSTMAVGIRGTCGWVEVPEGGGTMRVYLLEGRVECTAGGEKKTVSAGEAAVMTEGGDIAVEPFSARDIPDYIREELEGDDDLAEAILADSGMDVRAPLHSPEEEMAIEQFRGIISGADSYVALSYPDICGHRTGEYQYALVQVHAEDTAPTLLLRVIRNSINNNPYIVTETGDTVVMFRYDPTSQTAVPVVEGPEIFMAIRTTVWENGHIRYLDLLLGPDGVGLFKTTQHIFSDREDSIDHSQIGIQQGRLVSIIEGYDDGKYIPAEYQDLQPITWYSAQDASGLDNWVSIKN